MSLHHRVVGHWVVSPPCPFESLPSDVQQTNTYCGLEVHGLQCFDGDISLKKLRYHMYNIARTDVRAYTRSSGQAAFLNALMKHFELFEVIKSFFLSSGRKMNFCGPYRGRKILNVRPRPQYTFRVLCPLYKPRNTHFAAFEQKNYIYYHGRNL